MDINEADLHTFYAWLAAILVACIALLLPVGLNVIPLLLSVPVGYGVWRWFERG